MNFCLFFLMQKINSKSVSLCLNDNVCLGSQGGELG